VDLSPSLARWRTAAITLAGALTLALTALAGVLVSQQRGYAETSPEVGFARDMSVHHEQAVVMSLLVRERGTDPEVAQLARDIATGQGEERGVLTGWLHQHRVPATTTTEPMAWMGGTTSTGGHGAHDMAATPTSTEASATGAGADAASDPAEAARQAMGMATDDELRELGRLSGAEADLLYVRLMQRHHQGAVTMAEAFTDLSDEPQLSWLAGGALTTQQRELRLLADLEERLAAEA